MTFVLLGSESQGHRDGGQARASGTERYYLVLKEYSLARRRQGGATGLGVRPQMCTPRGRQLHTCPVAAVVNSASQQDALNKPPPWRLFLENSTAKPCEGGSCPKQPTLLRIQSLLELVFLACYSNQPHGRTDTRACKNGADAIGRSQGDGWQDLVEEASAWVY